MISGIQFLRAVAAIFVLIYHLVGSSLFSELLSNNSYLNELVSFLNVGVDVFFVLSGFIIVFSTDKKDKLNRLEFFCLRSVRIYPMYWIFTIILILIYSLPMVKGSLESSSHVAFSLLLMPTFNEAGEFYPLLFVGWTLVFEIYFYILFLISYSKNEIYFSIKLLFVLVGASFFAYIIDYPPLDYLVNNKIVTEFFFGIAVFYLYKKGIVDLLRNSRYLFLSVSVIIFVLLIKINIDLFAVKVYFSVLLLLICLLFDDKLSKQKLMLLIGSSSYSLYLSHSLFIMFLTGLWKRGLLPQSVGFDFVFIVLYSSIAIAFSIFYYMLVERNVTSFLNKKIKMVISGK